MCVQSLPRQVKHACENGHLLTHGLTQPECCGFHGNPGRSSTTPWKQTRSDNEWESIGEGAPEHTVCGVNVAKLR